ncbi:hypothetical protein HDV00_012049 [Rhizophlyctis rosea]|nr:hypothetical protein HDV00_012049 [Rhizophlyctis rosea]
MRQSFDALPEEHTRSLRDESEIFAEVFDKMIAKEGPEILEENKGEEGEEEEEEG